MTDNAQSSGERHIEKIMQKLEPDSERYQVLDTAKRFKSSWVELGDKLLQVSSTARFREWGYASFEEYCAQEIRIKKGTAEKLTLAYRYLERQEPELLARREELKPLPDYRSVDLLRRAREENSFSDEEYAELRKSVVEDERSHPTVLKRFNEVAAARGEAPTDPVIPLKTGLAAARRLDTALQAMPDVPTVFREQVRSLIEHLESELEALKIITTDSQTFES
jgi:hypothetical protein